MIIKTKEFQEVCKTIALAVDGNKACLELQTKENVLYLNVTNKEYYCAIKFSLENADAFRAVVDAKQFLDLVSGITSETFELKIKEAIVTVKSGKSCYKLPMIFENENMVELTPIVISNPSVEMLISKDILYSIINVNGKEVQKAIKTLDANELNKLYSIDENGCFTFTNTACLNAFKLEKPVKMLLNDRIVRLFKLFKSDVQFTLGHDPMPNGSLKTKVSFVSENIYLAANIVEDTTLQAKAQGACALTKNYIDETHPVHAVFSVKTLSDAIARFMQFTKNSGVAETKVLMANLSITPEELVLADKFDNNEVIAIEAGSTVTGCYDFRLNVIDLKMVLDSCREDDYITMNCGNYKTVVLTRRTVYNLLPEGVRRANGTE